MYFLSKNSPEEIRVKITLYRKPHRGPVLFRRKLQGATIAQPTVLLATVDRECSEQMGDS
jgi:hypothetical protein